MLVFLSMALASDVPAGAGARAKELATALVHAIGPRPSISGAGGRAQFWVQDGLTARGWEPRRLETFPGAVYACQPGASDRVVLFLAHTDTVAGSPGGNDNAAGVGVLLTAAELLRGVPTRRTVCLAFPDAEESGLRGSHALDQAASQGVVGGPVDQVMALDLVGVGALTHSGLGPPFGAARIRALLHAAPADVPWVYRAVSHARPELERSDHHAFNARGIPASHLMARGPNGFDWEYHRPTDVPDRLEVATLQAAVEAVVGVATADSLPVEVSGSPAFVVPRTGWVIPGWATWLGIGLGSVGGIAASAWGLPAARESLAGAVAWLAHAVLATLALGLAMFVALGFRRMDLDLADPVVLAGWAAWGAVAIGVPLEARPAVSRTLGAGAAVAMMLGMLYQGAPLLALPLAVSAAAVGASRWSRLWAGIAAWPALYLLRPDAIRELHFHRLFPAEVGWWTLVGGVLLLPLLGALPTRSHPGRRGAAGALAVVCVAAIVVAWGMQT